MTDQLKFIPTVWCDKCNSFVPAFRKACGVHMAATEHLCAVHGVPVGAGALPVVPSELDAVNMACCLVGAKKANNLLNEDDAAARYGNYVW